MQNLLDKFICADDINTLGTIPNIFNENFENEVARLLGTNANLRAKADSLLNAISSTITEKIESNPAFYKSLAAQIETILKDYKAQRINDEQRLNLARKMHEKLLAKSVNAKEFYPKKIAQKESLIAFYDNLDELLGGIFRHAFDKKVLTKDKFDKIITDLSLQIDEFYARICKKPQWFDSIEVKNRAKSALQDSIWNLEDEFGVKINENEIAKICEVLRNIAVDKYAK